MTWKDRKFWLYRCPRCTHQFVHPPVTPKDQAEIYSDQYFSSEGDWACGMFARGYEESTAELPEVASLQDMEVTLDFLAAALGNLAEERDSMTSYMAEAEASSRLRI